MVISIYGILINDIYIYIYYILSISTLLMIMIILMMFHDAYIWLYNVDGSEFWLYDYTNDG